MRISPVLSALALLASGLVLGAPPAAAHEDHSGWFIASPTSQSKNLKLQGSVERTRPANTYRNSDLAFWGTTAYAGHYDGFQIVDISDPGAPKQLADVACPGAQHDVSTWDGLLFVSVETPRSSPSCDSTTQSPGFEGIRIFDVKDPKKVSLIGAVPTDCGSHTHTLVPDTANGRVLLYVASYTTTVLAPSAFGNECTRFDAAGNRLHNKISVVEVPLAAPASAKVISEPRIPQNDYAPKDRGAGFLGCHDITVSLPLKRAAAACMGEGQIWDMTDPVNPRTIARIHNPNIEFFHSAAFSADGRTVVFGDEAGGGTQPRCRDIDAATTGALWFYDVAALDSMSATDVEPWLSSYKVPRPQGNANCTMHNFNTLPLKDRDVLVSSAYAAGTTVVDFTDRRKPVEVAHLDPHGANTWSSYWYNGRIITNDSGRGLDVLLLSDSARAGAAKLPRLNPQTQETLLRR